MIKTKSEEPKYRTSFTNDKEFAIADATSDKGGQGAGFRPHELLEAALGTCVNMSVRMFAEKNGIPLSMVSTKVELDRSQLGKTVFNYSVELEGKLSDVDRRRLLEIVGVCPVRQTLSKPIEFNRKEQV